LQASSEFPNWLANIQTDDKLILFIDAVNQLTGIGPEMHWLPEFIPSNIRLVISTTPETPLEELRKRGWQELEIQPLTSAARVHIVTNFLASFGKKLTDEQIEHIASEPKLESPLFLRTVLEEIRIYGHFSHLSDQIDHYLAADDEHELFQKVLGRMENDFGADTVRDVMTALWASRYGLTETELLEITRLPRYALSEFLMALEFHLMQRNGLYTFFHNYLRQAVEERYLNNEEKIKAAHRHLAHYFADSPYNSRRRDEEPWQWKEAEEYTRLREAIGDLEMFRMLTHEEQRYEFSKYLPKDESMEDVESFFDSKITEKQNELSIDEQAILHYQLGDLLLTSANCIPAAKQLEKAVVLAEASTLPQKTIFNIYLQLCDALQQKGDYETARNQIEHIMQDPKYGIGKDTPEYIKCLDLLGTLDNALGKYDLAEQKLTEALRLREQRKDVHVVELAHNYSNVASILSNSGRNEEALQYIEKAIKYLYTAVGEDHIETAKLLGNQGSILYRMRRLDEAMDVAEKARKIYTKLVGEMNSETARVIQNLSVIAGAMGNNDGAYQLGKKAFDIRYRVLGNNHVETMVSKIGIGREWQRNGNPGEAIKIYKECLEVFRKHMLDSDSLISLLKKRIEEAEQEMQHLT
jgi:nephrocystin-3